MGITSALCCVDRWPLEVSLCACVQLCLVCGVIYQARLLACSRMGQGRGFRVGRSVGTT